MFSPPLILLSLVFLRTVHAALCTIKPLGEGIDDTDQVAIAFELRIPGLTG